MAHPDPFTNQGPLTDHEILRQLYYGFQDFRSEARDKWTAQDKETAALRAQVEATNGRVKKQELWMAGVKGGVAVGALLLPTLTGVLVWALTT